MPEPKPLIAVMSAYTDVLISDVFDRGAVAFISKPHKSSYIIQTVKNALLSNETKWLDSKGPPDTATVEKHLESIEEALRLGLIGLGRGGMFLHMKEDFPIDEHPIKFNIDLKSNKPSRLAGHGIVRWMRPKGSRLFYSGVGIEFVGLSPESKEFVMSYTQSVQPTSFIPVGMIPQAAKT
jgi:hypothetical protein